MSTTMLDVTLHIDEETTHDEREGLRDVFLRRRGVMAADCRDDKPHLMIVAFDPENVTSVELLTMVKKQGYHAELIAM